MQLYSELQGRAYKCGSLNNIFFLRWCMQTVVLANRGKMVFFVTWEAFLPLAGLLGVCLLLPVDEFSKVWCQELVVQCTAAVCQAVQQCRWVHRASVESVLLSVHHCWDGDAGMVGMMP